MKSSTAWCSVADETAMSDVPVIARENEVIYKGYGVDAPVDAED